MSHTQSHNRGSGAHRTEQTCSHRASLHTGGCHHHCSSHMSLLMTGDEERTLSTIPLVNPQGMILPKLSHLSGLIVCILSRLDAFQEVVYVGISNKIISNTSATSPVP